MFDFDAITGENLNFICLGEAGSGKSEIAMHLALALARRGDKAVHFFDMDMTKPLFRARDQQDTLERAGVCVHFEAQFMDAPTAVGGGGYFLREAESYVVMDVGGDYIGARAIGGYAPILKRTATAVFYVINNYRPWSMDLEHIDAVLAQTLLACHLSIGQVQLIGNPNLGEETTAQDVVAGIRQLRETVGLYKPFACFCAREELCRAVAAAVSVPVMPLELHLTYPWSGHSSDRPDAV